MKLTDEQQAVIYAPESILKVNAIAGSGKTTTLLCYAACRPQQRILYLSFNRSSADSMRRKCAALNLQNIIVSTFHALAYHGANGRAYELIDDLSEWTILENYVRGEIKEEIEDLLLVSWLIKDMMIFYLNSAHIYIGYDLAIHYVSETMPVSKVVNLLDVHLDFIIETIVIILGHMKTKEVPAIHDFYLKQFQLSRPVLLYDIILIDEAQDLSGVMLSVLEKQAVSKVFVGDSFQQIYSFRYALNALERLDCPEYSLTQTFRFGDSLAQEVSFDVNRGYGILNETNRVLQIKGSNRETNIINFLSNAHSQKAVISRSVLKLFSEMAGYLEEDNLRFYFEGGYESYGFMNSRVFSVFHLYKENFEKISDNFIKRFSSFRKLKEFARLSQNHRLLNTCELIQIYQENIFSINREVRQRLVRKEEADVIFTTTHKAKGQEYQNIRMVKEDFITCEQLEKAVKKPDELNLIKLKEEINIFYVAATRAMENIVLHQF